MMIMEGVNEKLAASVSASELGSGSCESLVKGDDSGCEREDVNNGRKSTAQCRTKKLQGKKKHKVDWTPELHKRFVQAVEQLGLEKAIPSRILELMGIDCLTRHNVASHLQKYRTHQRRSLARKSQLASSKQRNSQIHGAIPCKTDMNPWIVPTTMGFPQPHFRPLHVWGHPSVEQSMHALPKHLSSLHPQHSWPSSVAYHPPMPPLVDPYFWHYSNHKYRFPSQPAPGVPPSPMYRLDPGLGVPVGQTMLGQPQPSSPLPPLKESVDTAIEDVLAKPWLPLPLGLRPPSVDSVMVELQRQGISKIPPTCV